jgi:16S rRNA processing protein RimM
MLPGLEAAELPVDAIEVGRIANAWGIKGWFKAFPHSADPEALFSSKSWYLLPAEKGPKTFSGPGCLVISDIKQHADTVVASAQGVEDRNGAEALRGARIFIARSSFPMPGEDEYYWVDLIGLNVVNREGIALGVVRELLATGLQTVLVLSFQHEGKSMERMIPFVAVYIDRVDLATRRIAVDWQPDY